MFLDGFEQQCSQCCCPTPLDHLTSFSPFFLPRYARRSISSHLCEWEKRSRWQLSIFRSLVRGRTTLLLRCGDVKRNPGPAATAVKKPKTDFLTVIHVNTRSLLRHFDDVSALVVTERPHILALSETWLDDSVSDAQVYLAGYRLLRSDRNRYGGGVAVFCVETLHCSLLSCGVISSGAEFLWISVACGRFQPSLAVGCFYRSPGAPSQSVNDICDSIEAMMLNRKHLIACGDFNINLLDPNTTLSKTFQNFITSHSLIQPISVPTRYSCSSASILDLFLTTSDISISSTSVLDTAFSDHLPILLRIDSSVPCPTPTLISYRSFKHFSKASFEEDLSAVPWCVMDAFDDPDDKLEAFNLLFSDVLDQHAPVKTVRVQKKPSLWITKSVRKKMDRRNRLFWFYRRNPTTAAWVIYKAQRNRVVQLQRNAKSAYFHRLLLKKSHPSALWNTLKLATCTSVHKYNSFSTGSDPTSIADNLNSHFASVSCNTIAPAYLSSVSSPATPTSTSMPILSLTPTTPEWCEQALPKLNPRCATGLDQLPPSALIAGQSIICFPLSSIINSSISSFISNFPCQWKCASIRPLHKGVTVRRQQTTDPSPFFQLVANSWKKCPTSAVFTPELQQPSLSSSVWLSPFPLHTNSTSSLLRQVVQGFSCLS